MIRFVAPSRSFHTVDSMLRQGAHFAIVGAQLVDMEQHHLFLMIVGSQAQYTRPTNVGSKGSNALTLSSKRNRWPHLFVHVALTLDVPGFTNLSLFIRL